MYYIQSLMCKITESNCIHSFTSFIMNWNGSWMAKTFHPFQGDQVQTFVSPIVYMWYVEHIPKTLCIHAICWPYIIWPLKMIQNHYCGISTFHLKRVDLSINSNTFPRSERTPTLPNTLWRMSCDPPQGAGIWWLSIVWQIEISVLRKECFNIKVSRSFQKPNILQTLKELLEDVVAFLRKASGVVVGIRKNAKTLERGCFFVGVCVFGVMSSIFCARMERLQFWLQRVWKVSACD